jgi:hypothetical protein
MSISAREDFPVPGVPVMRMFGVVLILSDDGKFSGSTQKKCLYFVNNAILLNVNSATPSAVCSGGGNPRAYYIMTTCVTCVGSPADVCPFLYQLT